MNSKLHISGRGLDFIKHFEGFPNGGRAYNDPVGHCTKGYGALLHYGNCTRAELNAPAWSEETATKRLRRDIVAYEDMVKRRITVKLNQNEFDALVSFVYNLGEGAIIPRNSDGSINSTLAVDLNRGDRKGAAGQFERWNKAGSPPRPMAGLTRRRLSERDMFLKGDYTPRSYLVADKQGDGGKKGHPPKIVVKDGAPHWGGAEDIIVQEVLPVAKNAGFSRNSGKRSETYGNPGSDHYVGNRNASAADFPTGENYALRNKIMRKLGVTATINDYGSYNIQREGHTYRVQPIAQNHGTGPHLHIGIRRID